MKFLTCILLLLLSNLEKTSAQTVRPDTIRNYTPQFDSSVRVVADTLKRSKDTIPAVEKHSPRKATLRSALIPGWGQAYNKEYWKIPLVYGVVGIPAGFFIFNNTWYKRSKKAFEIRITNDSGRIPEIHPDLKDLNSESLRFYRNQFRRDRDYSILYFLAAWGLQVVDATVFGHLKEFDVSDDLSFQIKPGYSPTANTSGLSLVLAVKNPSKNVAR
jgi:hypothetical protein